MNILATMIFTSNTLLKKLIIERLHLVSQIKDGQEIFVGKNEEENLVLVFSKNNDFSLEMVKQYYEVNRVFLIGDCVALGDIDIESGDVMLPNTLISEQNQALFLESIIDKNYDLKKFGLLLNGMCYTRSAAFSSPEEIQSLQEEYLGDILDYESFYFAQEMEKNDMLSKTIIIKVNGSQEEELENGVGILELML